MKCLMPNGAVMRMRWPFFDVPNHVAAEMCLRHGWAYSLAAAWLRCKLKGELSAGK